MHARPHYHANAHAHVHTHAPMASALVLSKAASQLRDGAHPANAMLLSRWQAAKGNRRRWR